MLGRWFRIWGSSMDCMFGIPIYGSDKGVMYRYLVKPSYRVVMGFRSVKYWLYYRFHPQHKYHLIDTKLKPSYYDVDHLMLHGMFALLRRYVEDELGGRDKLVEYTDELRNSADAMEPWAGATESQVCLQDDVLKLYDWWMTERPADLDRRDDLMSKVYGRDRFIEKETIEVKGMTLVRTEMREDDEDEAAHRPDLKALDDKIEREETEFLHKLIDLRKELWT